MDKVIEQLISSSPGIAACVAIVVLFLRYQKHKDDQFVIVLAEMAEARKHASDVIETNSKIVGENTRACYEMTETMRALKAKMM